ncbi:zinc finger protein 808-like [Toxorhynchites rutilus septentrionalis]|uniref:zinc finger protein 808-like n=1 Tax=Toxorhynchites rutilus septentrionalis TaxID=329112 RepID=UPI00247926C7|nr:zinc finger protein 808-like [Toxorhynchites rutilus septentrionalis]
MSLSQIVDQLCRICSKSSTNLISLNEIVNGRTLTEMLLNCVTIEVFEGDNLPFHCCLDCKFDLIVAYHLVIRCKESDILFRSQLTDSKDAILLLSHEINNATNSNQFKAEFKTENECVFAEPICDLYVSNDEQPNILLRNESESFNNVDDANHDNKIGGGYIQENTREDGNETNPESTADDSDADEIVNERKHSEYVKAESSSSPKRCCKCKTRLENTEQVEQHSKIHIESKITDEQITKARPFECPVCFKRYTRKRDLLHHQREMYIEKKFQCDECDDDFLTEAQLVNHKKSHDKDNIGNKIKLPKCCACYQQFESVDLLRKHADEIHLPESQTSTNDHENKFSCDICHRRFKTKRTLLTHKSKPNRGVEYQCAQCGKILRYKRALSDHERFHHGNERPYVCSICTKAFAGKEALQRHMKVHSKEDRFKCEICNKGFKLKYYLKNHYITHNPDYRPISCSLCSATFTRKISLKSHMKMHTGDRPYKCDICDASYPFSSDLKRHIMAHKGIKPYICNICGRGYPRPDYLRRHLASHGVNTFCLVEIECVWKDWKYTRNNPGRNGSAMSLLQIVDQLCRICSKSSTKIISLNEIVDGRTLVEMLRYCVTVEVCEGDDLPFQCCVDCKFDLVVAYNLVTRCKESDALFRSQLTDSKDALRLLSYASNNATNVSQLKTEFKTENECVYAEPICGLYVSNDEPTNKLVREESRSSLNFKNDDEIGVGCMQEDDREDDNESNLESNVDDSDVDGIVYERKLSEYVREESSSSPKRCCKCKTRLESIEQVEQHSKIHIESRITDEQIIIARPFECPVCFKRYTRKRALLFHQREMYIEKKFQCDECNDDFLTEAQLVNHKKSHDRDKMKLPKCCACYQQFESVELLRKHADEIHLPESQTSANDNVNKFICDICHRRFKSRRTLLIHKSRPNRAVEYQCAQCGKILRNKRALSDHEQCHQGERPHVCSICTKTYAGLETYRKHMKLHSIEQDRFKCEVCGKGFKTSTYLKCHYITHNPDYRPLNCSLCSATFARNTSLKSHMKMHTGDRPFKCNICDRSYPFSNDLKRHIMAHKGIKPHICNICGKGYPRLDYLRKHVASHDTNN